MNSPREYLKIKYSAPTNACKCGNCQLVPPENLGTWAVEIEQMQKLINAVAKDGFGAIAACREFMHGRNTP